MASPLPISFSSKGLGASSPFSPRRFSSLAPLSFPSAAVPLLPLLFTIPSPPLRLRSSYRLSVAPMVLLQVVGDLTLGKPDLVEFYDTQTVEAAARAIACSSGGSITLWKQRPHYHHLLLPFHAAEEYSRTARFVGMLNSLDVVAYIARTGGDHVKALRAPVSEVVHPNPSLLKEVDPNTRLVDALEMMKKGVRCLLVRKGSAGKDVSQCFSFTYSGKWLKNIKTSAVDAITTNSGETSHISSSSFPDNSKFCCLSREDVIRFLIGCLGALAPLPLTSISTLDAINPHYVLLNASSPAIEVVQKTSLDPSAVAVIEMNPDGIHKIIGEISSYKFWKCDFVAAAWAIANLSAGHFVIASEDNNASPRSLPDFPMSSPAENSALEASPRSLPEFLVTLQGEDTPRAGITPRGRKFSSRSMGFYSELANPQTVGGVSSMYRERSKPLMCNHTSSLAAVMAQMLSHRATHIWVKEAGSDDVLVGVVGYADILYAVTRYPSSVV